MLLNDTDGEASSKAAVALANIAGTNSIEILNQQLRTGGPRLRTYMAAALGNINDQRAVAILIRCLNDGQASVRCNAAKSLALTIGCARKVAMVGATSRAQARLFREASKLFTGPRGRKSNRPCTPGAESDPPCKR